MIGGNLVAFNTLNGIEFQGNLSAAETQVQIVNNLVGTTFSGSSTFDAKGVPQGNGLDGIRLEQSSTSLSGTISGVASAVVAYNVSSDNGLSGINVETGSGAISYAEVSIFGNHVGTDITGSLVSAIPGTFVVPFGNGLDGILLNEVLGVTVGGSTLSAGNLISGNLGRGIEMLGDSLNFGSDTSIQNDLPSTPENLIQDNLIGLGGAGLTVVDANSTDLGNVSDGIFLLDPGAEVSLGDNQMVDTSVVIQGNTISNNAGAGIHADVETGVKMSPDGLQITDNMIGTNPQGTVVEVPAPGSSSLFDSLGNDSDGVFLDGIPETKGMTALVTIDGNLISGNHANGIDLLYSYQVLVTDNKIGTQANGSSTFGDPQNDFGNAANGVFINQSSDITIGGTTQGSGGIAIGGANLAEGNLISGNHASGVFISGTTGNNGNANSNVVEGNIIGLDEAGTSAVPNAVVGIVLSNASDNIIGAAAGPNAISGNLLDGILLANDAESNSVSDNLIGTDPTGSTAIPNSADGIFLLGGAGTVGDIKTTSGTISGNVISANVISGNGENGIQVFGTGAYKNTVSGNMIGLARGGESVIPNGGNGVYLNDAGDDTAADANVVGPGNVISGNDQSGVLILGTLGGGGYNEVVGNFIGTDATGQKATYLVPSGNSVSFGNGGNGVSIYGTSWNTIRRHCDRQPGSSAADTNVISANAQAGIQIFSPASSALANHNLVEGNLIGTNVDGGSMSAGGNGSNGVEIDNGSFNSIGGATVGARNVISGNADNGVLIEQLSNLPASSNVVQGNYIGTDFTGTTAIGNVGNGVELIDAASTTIGGATGGTPLGSTEAPQMLGGGGNLISGNSQWGIQILLTASTNSSAFLNTVESNFIGVDLAGTSAIGNGLGGVLVENVSSAPISQTIGGSTAGAGNVISGNNGVGLELDGPQTGSLSLNNVVQGNLIGLGASGGILDNGVGILLNNSPNNMIGGTSPSDCNVISGNSQQGIQVFETGSTGNLIVGNFIGTNLTGTGFPTGINEASDFIDVGVFINAASSNTIGEPGAGNVISGNSIGVEIAGLNEGSVGFKGGSNVVESNKIGTDVTGMNPVPNLDLGVLINNSSSNVIGGQTPDMGNLISANGVAGIQIFSDDSKANMIWGNQIGANINGAATFVAGAPLTSDGFEAGIPIFANSQSNGIVILGAPDNTVGAIKQGKSLHGLGNTIRGNLAVGVYITSVDFSGITYPAPVNNMVSDNVIQSNGQYGILLYDAPGNQIRPFTSVARQLVNNKMGGNQIPFFNYVQKVDAGDEVKRKVAKHPKTTHSKPAVHRTKEVTKVAHPAPSVRARPRVPTLFDHVAGGGVRRTIPARVRPK